MQVCTHCSTSQLVQWLHLGTGHLNNFIRTMSLAFLQVYLSRGSSRNTKRSRHWWAHSFENTEHISFQSWRQVWATDIEIARPEIETSSLGLGCQFIIAGVPTVTQFSWDSARFHSISADDKALSEHSIMPLQVRHIYSPKHFQRCNWAEVIWSIKTSSFIKYSSSKRLVQITWALAALSIYQIF